MRFLFSTLGFLALSFPLVSQSLTSFSEDNREFFGQLQGYLSTTASKTTEELWAEFEDLYKAGVYSPEEIALMRQTGNGMLAQRMAANPYFTEYLRCAVALKKSVSTPETFTQWHQIAIELVNGIQNRKVGPFQDFLEFSNGFFTSRALRLSTTGISWIANSTKYAWKIQNNQPKIIFEELDLLGIRKQDSIAIYQTKGAFYPTEGLWKGEGGRVTWERFGLPKEVYAELGSYQIEVSQSLYQVEEAKLRYPQYFGERIIPGKFEDKLTSANPAVEGSYPRFVSKDDIIRIDKIGKGIQYTGGFRLQGTTVYGYGSKENPAKLEIAEGPDQLALRAFAELFTIRREERIVGEKVACTLYLGSDSLAHPSVNFRFEIPKRQLQLDRGERGSDRNPFFSSVQQMNIDADKINYYLETDSIVIGEKSLVFNKRITPVSFESLDYFQEDDYNRLQNISSYNPIAVIKAVAEREGTNFLDANFLASKLDSRFTVDNIQSLLYDLVAKGFINYDAESQMVEVKDKIFHYANASQKKTDFDNIRIESETEQTNAVFDVNTQTMVVNGVTNVGLSDAQKVAFKPYFDQILLRRNRDIDFDGKIFAGYSAFTGKDFHFQYEPFQIIVDSAFYFDLFLLSDTLDERGQPKAYSIASRIEKVNGVLLVDAPKNKSGKDNIAMFPSFQSKDISFVYYDRKETQNGVYGRDSFYFQLDKFTLNSLDNYGKENLVFKGRMFSNNIFPEFNETLRLVEEDQSLGFSSPTPAEGYPIYQKKGQYKGQINLSNKGFLGEGSLAYLGATINSEDFVFRPEQLTGSAREFFLEEDRKSAVKVPRASGVDVNIDWRPYRDSMYITSQGAPFELFKENRHFLEGTLILTPSGLKGRGVFSWDQASMRSPLFSFGANSVTVDTADLQIKAFDADALALKTSNLNGVVDFDVQKGSFKANARFLRTIMPFNQYETSMNEFDWDMKNESIVFRTREGEIGNFLSTHPDKDSLWFQGKAATFSLRTNELDISGVPSIVSADAYIFPDQGLVQIQPGGEMARLQNARIVADTIDQYHVINRCLVQIKGKKDFTATGYYEYNVGTKKQEILFQNIVGSRIGKGSQSDKQVATRATGEVTLADRFYIDTKTEFQGIISLYSESPNLQFNGFARLEANLPGKHWFGVNFEGDKRDLSIRFDEPKNYEGEPLATGLFLSKESGHMYSRIMSPLYFRKDRQIFPVKGLFNYNDLRDEFVFGDSAKVLGDANRGNLLVFQNKTGKLEAEGRFFLGGSLKYISMVAAGRAEANVEVKLDTMAGGPVSPQVMKFELMAGMTIRLPDELMKMVLADFQSSSFEAQSIIFANEPSFYKKAISELFPTEDKEIARMVDVVALNEFAIPKKFNNFSFFFSKLNMRWDPELQSFIALGGKLPLAALGGEMFNKMVTGYVEVRMPMSDDDDRLYVFLQSPSGFYYFFGYRQGILNVVSSNTKFNDAVMALKDKDRILKMEDGLTYEIQLVNQGTATEFVSRVQAAQAKY